MGDEKKKPVEIKKVVIQLPSGKELLLRVEDAKKLREALNDLFGQEVVKEHHHHHSMRWYWEYPTYRSVPCGSGTAVPPMFGWDDSTAMAFADDNAVLTLNLSGLE